MRIHIRNGRVLDPANQVDRVTDLFIAEGRIIALDRQDGFQPDRTIDARDCLVIPGLVDLCARLREPGAEYKATIHSEVRAAVRAGVTTLCMPPDTDPVIDNPAVVELIQRRSRLLGLATIHTLGALTKSLAGETLAEMDTLKAAGCLGVSNALVPVVSSQVLRRAFEYAASCNMPVFYFAEDAELRGRGVAHEGAVSTRLGLPGIPECAETVAVSRALLLAEQTGARLHFCRLTSGRSLELLAGARDRGLDVSADAGIAYLHLTDEALLSQDPSCHLSPPLRDEANRRALVSALADNRLDAICSDHQPHDTDAKAGPLVATEAGAATLSQWLALTLRLANAGDMPLDRAVAAVTVAPARILGLSAGTLTPDSDADVCVVDPKAPFSVDAGAAGRGRNTPFRDHALHGQVRYTLRHGQFSHDIDNPL